MSAESIARHIFDLAGILPVGEDGIAHVAGMLLGDDQLDFAQQIPFVTVLCAPWRLLVRDDLCDEDLTIALAHGVAEWWLRTHPGDARRIDVRLLAETLALPAVALREAIDRIGEDVDAIAEEFVLRPELVERRLRAMPVPRRSGIRARAAS